MKQLNNNKITMSNTVERDLIKLKENAQSVLLLEPDPSSVAKQLLAANAAEEVDALLDLGISHELKATHEAIKEANIRNSLEERLGKNVFTRDELKQLQMKYFLRLAPVNLYRGPIPRNLGAILVDFCKKNNIVTKVEDGNFFVLAPPNMFSDYETFWEKHKVYADGVVELKKSISDSFMTTMDPHLLYRIPGSNGTPKYAHVHGWGNDFSFLRRVVGLLRQTSVLPVLYWFMVRLIIPSYFLIKAIYWLDDEAKYLESVKEGHTTIDILLVATCIILTVNLICFAIGAGYVFFANDNDPDVRRLRNVATNNSVKRFL